MNLTLIAAFLRTLGLVSPLLGVQGVAKITDAVALLLETGEAGRAKLEALVAELKARADAGVQTTAEEILADIGRIEDLDRQIQDAGQSGRIRPALLGVLLGLALSVAAIAPAFSAEPARQASLSWGAVTQDVEGNTITGVTYSVYRGLQGGQKARVAQNLATLAYVDAGRPAGVTECYVVTAVKGADESAPSSEGCKSYPAVRPAAPAGLTVQ
jgi:hypothetical protein